jgi:hypothetical protein
MCSAGFLIFLIALWSAKSDIAQASSLDKVVALNNLCFAAPLAVFGALHLAAAESLMPMVLVWGTSLAVLVACAALLDPGAMPAAPVAVRHTEGLVHGFLVLRTVAGDTLADGDLIQVARGDRVTSRLVFRFKDGSLHDETAVFSQRHNFRLLSDHLVQKGPAFQHPMEVSIDGFTGQVTVRSTGDDGKEKVVTGRFDLPPDVVNGLVLILLKNIRSDVPQTKVSMVAATPKPRLVKLAITPQGEDLFSIGGASRKATHYVVKVEIGGRCRAGGAAAGEATPRYPRLDSRWRRSGLRQIGGPALLRWPHLAD